MSCINSFPLYLLSLSFLLPLAFAVDPLYHICSTSFNYTSGSSYDNNLKVLFNQLNLKVPPTGFGQSSVGKSPDTVRGLGLCRGDTSSTDCKSCVSIATQEIQQRCPNDKAAIIWYDGCLVKYSNVNFLGAIDSENKFYLYNVRNVSDVEGFNAKTKEFLSGLTNKAYRTPKLFATDEIRLDRVDKLYGLVQCTRDISDVQCKKCLDDAIAEFPSCCDGRRGGRVITGSCNFRYELYPFVITAKV